MRRPLASSPNYRLWHFSITAASALFLAALAIATTFFLIHQQKVKEISARSELINHIMIEKSLTPSLSAIDQLKSGARALMELKEFNSITLINAAGTKVFEFGQPIHPNELSKSFTRTERWREGQALYTSYKIDQVGEQALWVVSTINLTRGSLVNLQFLFILLLIIFCILSFSIIFYRRINHQIFLPLEILNESLSKQNKMREMTPIILRDKGIYEELIQQLNESFSIHIEKEMDLKKNMDAATQELRESLETVEIHNIDLDMARKNAVELNKLKSEFLKKIGDDLHSPLAGVLDFSELLRKTKVSELQRDYISTIEQSIKGLITIVNDIYDFSRLESGTLQVDKKPVSIRRTIEECLTLQSAKAQEDGITLYNSVDQDVPSSLQGDPLRIQQVLSNLVSNAMKFDQTSFVETRVKNVNQINDSSLIRIEITTNGDCPKDFFDWTNSIEQSNRETYSGAGLGLSVAKGIAQHMKGRIEFEIMDELCAFIVHLNLPLSKDEEPPRPVIEPNHHVTALIYSNSDVGFRELASRLYELGIRNKRAENFSEIISLAKKITAEEEQHLSHAQIAVIETQTTQQSFDKIVLTETIKSLEDELNIPTIVLPPTGQYEQIQRVLKDIDTEIIQRPIITSKFRKCILDQLGFVKGVSDSKSQMESSSNTKINILVVDDNPANLKLASAMLSEFHASIHTANTGKRAIDAYENQHFDIVFMDIQLPDINGAEVTTHIRSLEQSTRQGHRTPIIALTAQNIGDEKASLLLAGLDDVIGKPLTLEDIRLAISRWVSNMKVPSMPALTNDQRLTQSRLISSPELKNDEESQSISETSVIPVNISECLKLAKNDPQLALDMLSMLVESLENEKSGIEESVQSSNLGKLYDHVHRVHGACCYCGVPRLKQISKQLDKQLRENNTDNLEANIHLMFDAMNELCDWANQHDLKAIFDL